MGRKIGVVVGGNVPICDLRHEEIIRRLKNPTGEDVVEACARVLQNRDSKGKMFEAIVGIAYRNNESHVQSLAETFLNGHCS